MPETVDKKPQVSLKSLMTPSKTVAIEFPRFKDMTVDLCYLAREELVKLRKKCLTTKWDKKTHQPIEEFDDERRFKISLSFKFLFLNENFIPAMV